MIKSFLSIFVICISHIVCGSDHTTQVFDLAHNKQWESVYHLIDAHKVDVNIVPTRADDQPLLVMAADQGNINAVKELLNRQANININHILTPLMAAIRNHFTVKPNEKLIGFLLEHGADPRICGGNGYTSIQYAEKIGRSQRRYTASIINALDT